MIGRGAICPPLHRRQGGTLRRRRQKAATKRTHDGLPVHSSIAARRSGHRHPKHNGYGAQPGSNLRALSEFTPLQERAFQLLGTEVRL